MTSSKRLENRSWFAPKSLLVIVLACLWGVLSAVAVSAEDEPFFATVIGQDAFLRSGPGNDYYATNRVRVGETLEVYYVIDDQWCAVRPPNGSFTWVDARKVRLDKNQIGEVLINGVNARVGSELGNMCGAIQVVLGRGEKVFVFERIETPNDIDTPVWYKIAPPAGEFRFIRMNELQFRNVPDSHRDVNGHSETQSPIIQVSGEQPRQQSSRPSSSQLSSNIVPPGSLPIPGMSRSQQTQDNSVRIAANTRPSPPPPTTQQSNSLQPLPQVESADGDIDSDDFREILGQLKLDLADALLAQETANETLQSLAHQARMLYQSAANPNDRAEVYQLIVGIERATRVRRHEAEQDRANDGRMMQIAEKQVPPPLQPAQPQPPVTRERPSGTTQRLELPRMEINTMPRPGDAPSIEQYPAQESFFDDSGRHVTSQNDIEQGQYAEAQDYEIYLDRHNRYVDASGRVIDGQTLGAILHGADVVLMYDPQSGGYRQVSPQQLRSGQYPGAGRQQNPVPQKSWLQRLVSGELFQSDNNPQGQQHGYSQYGDPPYGQIPTGSGYAPYTYQSAFGSGYQAGDMYGYDMPGNNAMYGNASMQQRQQQPAKQGLFATSQPSLIAQQTNRGSANRNNAMPGMYPNSAYPNNAYPNNAPRGWQSGFPASQGGAANMMMQEITLPDGVPAGEVIVYDESRGVNLIGNMQNASEQDQLNFLIQQMAVPSATPSMTGTLPVVNPQPGYTTPRVNLPVTEAETRMREFQLRSARQEATPNRNPGQVTGRLENGVGRSRSSGPPQLSADAFDAIGKLGRVTNLGDDTKRYALVDAGGKAICLVTPTPGVELEPYVNQTVGLTGIWGLYLREGDSFRQISAKAVYPIVGSRE